MGQKSRSFARKASQEKGQNVWELFRRFLRGIDGILFLLLAYIVLFAIYQWVEPWMEQRWWGLSQESKEFCAVLPSQMESADQEGEVGKTNNLCQSAGAIHLAIESPGRVIYQGTLSSSGQPLTLWAWSDQVGNTVPSTIVISLQSESNEIVFRDWDGKETAPSVELPLGTQSASAPRQTLFLQKRRPLSSGEQRFALGVNSNGQAFRVSPKDFSLQLESPWHLSLRNLLAQVFNTTVGAIVATSLTVLKLYQEHRDKVQKTREEFYSALETLRKADDIEGAAEEYLRIWQWARTKRSLLFPEWKQHARLIWKTITQSRSFGRPWLIGVRRSLVNSLDDSKSLRERIALFRESEVGFREEELETLKKFTEIDYVNVEDEAKFREYLKIALGVFGLVGVGGEKVLLKKIAFSPSSASSGGEKGEATDTSDDGVKKRATDYPVLKEVWYERGGAAGRYLLRRMAAENSWIREKLAEWWKEEPRPPRQLRGRARLWPAEPLCQPIGEVSPWSNPFGPLRAEDDPRLPAYPKGWERPDGLFWPGHKIWREGYLKDKEHRRFQGRAGAGISAFILMTLAELSPWHPREPGFAVYLPLVGEPSVEALWDSFNEHLARSLLRSLLQYPFWLLTADEETQFTVSACLHRWSGNHFDLFLSRLKAWGFSNADADDQFTLNILLHYTGRGGKNVKIPTPYVLERIRESMAQASEKAAPEEFPFVTLVELVPPVPEKQQRFEQWLTILGDQDELWRLTAVKVFKPLVEEDDQGDWETIEWETEQIVQLLKHRRKQCRFLRLDDSLLEKIAARAKGAPQKAIRLGNEVLRS